MPIKNILASFILIFSLSGCTYLYDTFVYQIDVTQGNYIDEEKVSQIELGMTQEQVIFILGSPMLIDQFDSSKWYYVRSIKPGGEKVQVEKIQLTFENRVLEDVVKYGEFLDNPLVNNPNAKKAPNEAAESSKNDRAPSTDNSQPVIPE
ncbi:MAG: outer membrane protein assembly factor BamE [Psychromonas sp.]